MDPSPSDFFGSSLQNVVNVVKEVEKGKIKYSLEVLMDIERHPHELA